MIRPKLYGNRAFPQNFHTRKLGEITVFFAVCQYPEGFNETIKMLQPAFFSVTLAFIEDVTELLTLLYST